MIKKKVLIYYAIIATDSRLNVAWTRWVGGETQRFVLRTVKQKREGV